MSELYTDDFGFLDIPTVEEPTYSPPVKDPTETTDTPEFEDAALVDDVPAETPETARRFRPTRRQLVAVGAAVAVIVVGAAFKSESDNGHRLQAHLTATEKSLTTTQHSLAASQADAAAKATTITTLNGQISSMATQVSTLQGQVGSLQGQTTALQGQNSTLQQFSSRVTSLVHQFNTCVSGYQQFVSDLADGNPYAWTDSRISNLVDGCNAAQTGLRGLSSV